MEQILEKNISRSSVHSWIYFLCLCLLVLSIPTSGPFIFISQALLIINWLAEGQLKFKFKKFFSNKPALIFASIFFIHLVSLLWTDNLLKGLSSELLTKLPILTLTLVIVTSPPLDIKKIRIILFLFIATVLTVSFIGFHIYITRDITDFRHLAPYASHLYLSLMLIISAFLLPWLTKQVTQNYGWLITSFALSAWMIFFLMLTRTLSGLVSLTGVLIFFILWIIVNHKNVVFKISTAFIFITVIVLSLWGLNYMHNLVTHKVETDLTSLNQYTNEGNPYYHDTTRTLRENGHFAYIYISEKELKNEWNKKSEIDYYGQDKLDQDVRYTLFRYMASKGLRKDKEHFKELTKSDIRAIEEGKTNHLYKNWPGILIRVHQAMMGIQKYRETNDPTWGSFTQRIDLWGASYQAFKKKPLIGWGIGDIYEAVQYGLAKNNSELQGKQMKPHNQYLIILLTLGSLGLILFLVFYIYTVIKTKAYTLFPFNIIIVTFAVDMTGNNPIDAQFGLTMFVFFTLYFGFIYPNKSNCQNFNKKSTQTNN